MPSLFITVHPKFKAAINKLNALNSPQISKQGNHCFFIGVNLLSIQRQLVTCQSSVFRSHINLATLYSYNLLHSTNQHPDIRK